MAIGNFPAYSTGYSVFVPKFMRVLPAVPVFGYELCIKSRTAFRPKSLHNSASGGISFFSTSLILLLGYRLVFQ